jgi:heme oxygenase (mycobilin-producing)
MSHRSASLRRCFTTASGRESFSESAGSQDQLKHAPRSVPSNPARPGRQPDIQPQPSSRRSGNRARRSLCHLLRAEKSSGTARTGDSRTAGGSGQTLRRIARSSFTHTATVPSLRRRARTSRQGVKVPGWAAWSHDRHQDQCDHGAQESGDELAHQFAARAGVVHDADGFDGFALLKPTDDQKQWLVLTGWRDEESFQAWLGSESFADGHRSAAEGQGGSAPQPVARQARCGPTSWSADPITVELRGPLRARPVEGPLAGTQDGRGRTLV